MTHALNDGKATQQQTKAHNDSLVLSTIYEADEISRAGVARRTALSRTSVSEAVAELLERDLVEEIGRGRPSMGKPPILLRVKSDSRNLIGLDLSGPEFRGAVVNLRGDVLHALDLPREGRSGAAALELTYVLLDRLVSEANAPLLGLGIGTPGLIDFERGSQVHWAVNLDWLDVPLRDLLEMRYGLPVHVLNDSQAAAMGEYFFGASHETGNLVVIKCEEGLGAGIVLEGRLLHGDNFGAGEIGHLVFAEGGLLCRCGNTGCLEALAGGAALGWAGEAAAREGRSERLRTALDQRGAVTAEDVARAASFGDPVAVALLQSAGRRVGSMLASVVNFFNPSLIVIGGGVANSPEQLLASIRETVYRRSLPLATRDLLIQRSSLGGLAGVIGASSMVVDQLFARDAIGQWIEAGEPAGLLVS